MIFGLGFIVRKMVTSGARACGTDEQTANTLGKWAGRTTTVLTFDPSGLLDNIADVFDIGSTPTPSSYPSAHNDK